MAARTAFFDQLILDAIEDGTTQIVIVGAGYDGRAVRFREPGVRFFEVDHPATQADKRRRLARLGISARDVTFVPLDLTRGNVDSGLGGVGHDAAQASLFICEGLVGYLPGHTLESLWLGLRQQANEKSTLAVNFLVRPPARTLQAKLRRSLVDFPMRVIGEPRRSDFGPGEPERGLERTGWKVLRSEHADQRRASGGSHLVVTACPSDLPRQP
jgi:methyltransferase (TIGR00027 family)